MVEVRSSAQTSTHTHHVPGTLPLEFRDHRAQLILEHRTVERDGAAVMITAATVRMITDPSSDSALQASFEEDVGGQVRALISLGSEGKIWELKGSNLPVLLSSAIEHFVRSDAEQLSYHLDQIGEPIDSLPIQHSAPKPATERIPEIHQKQTQVPFYPAVTLDATDLAVRSLKVGSGGTVRIVTRNQEQGLILSTRSDTPNTAPSDALVYYAPDGSRRTGLGVDVRTVLRHELRRLRRKGENFEAVILNAFSESAPSWLRAQFALGQPRSENVARARSVAAEQYAEKIAQVTTEPEGIDGFEQQIRDMVRGREFEYLTAREPRSPAQFSRMHIAEDQANNLFVELRNHLGLTVSFRIASSQFVTEPWDRALLIDRLLFRFANAPEQLIDCIYPHMSDVRFTQTKGATALLKSVTLDSRAVQPLYQRIGDVVDANCRVQDRNPTDFEWENREIRGRVAYEGVRIIGPHSAELSFRQPPRHPGGYIGSTRANFSFRDGRITAIDLFMNPIHYSGPERVGYRFPISPNTDTSIDLETFWKLYHQGDVETSREVLSIPAADYLRQFCDPIEMRVTSGGRLVQTRAQQLLSRLLSIGEAA